MVQALPVPGRQATSVNALMAPERSGVQRRAWRDKLDYQVSASTSDSGLADVPAFIVNRRHIQLSNRSGRGPCPSEPDRLGLTAHGTEVTEAYRHSRAHSFK